ncbi:serine protease [Phlyctochytrium bullatum]|nr:serine protease [Phlyctochytrium bullatum]
MACLALALLPTLALVTAGPISFAAANPLPRSPPGTRVAARSFSFPNTPNEIPPGDDSAFRRDAAAPADADGSVPTWLKAAMGEVDEVRLPIEAKERGGARNEDAFIDILDALDGGFDNQPSQSLMDGGDSLFAPPPTYSGTGIPSNPCFADPTLPGCQEGSVRGTPDDGIFGLDDPDSNLGGYVGGNGAVETPAPSATTNGAPTYHFDGKGPLGDLVSVAYPAPTIPATTVKFYRPGASETAVPSRSGELEPDSPVPTNIENQYIISLYDTLPGSKIAEHLAKVKKLVERYVSSGKNVSAEVLNFFGIQTTFNSKVWSGYAGTFPPEVIALLKNSSLVEYIEPNRIIKAAGFVYDATVSGTGNLQLSESSLLRAGVSKETAGRPLSVAKTGLQKAGDNNDDTPGFTEATSADPAGITSAPTATAADPSSTVTLSAGATAGLAGAGSINASVAAATADQLTPPWNLDRIGHRANSPLGLFRHFKNGGLGVDIYVLDTGVRVDHEEFEGRAIFGKDFTGTGNQDSNGHGTHVAAIAAGKTFGVAKKANIIAVKVLGKDGTGTTEMVALGLQWVVTQVKSKPGVRAVVNLSLGGGGKSQALKEHVDTLVALGVPVAVAAGNSGSDACANSPADSDNVLTVGALAQDDSKAAFSNFGRCVSLYAPGKEIQSAGITGSTSATAFESGTSQASPLVAGVLANYMALYPAISVQDAYVALLARSYRNVSMGNLTTADNKVLLTAAISSSVDVDAIRGTGNFLGFLVKMTKLAFD